ncbi:ATP-binding protein [Aquimarina latercula]|uniref:ATP-binding protein n=1 Tax=Aquimarina latercula TaxID=987 RepID=UPI00048757C5|nr:ATP-binding protein [Aquimarina latercula]
MTDVQKTEIVKTINAAITRFGSANKFAINCGVSAATLSQMRNCEWENISVGMWQKVAAKSGYSYSTWNIAETTNYKLVQKVLNEAKEECLFVPISYPAGSGKSAGLKAWIRNNPSFNFYVECKEWGKRDFLKNLITQLGMELPRTYATLDMLTNIVINFFIERRDYKPTLILDQANSLSPTALKVIIHIFNALEDEMSLIICGTENLKKTIDAGVKYNKDGYDEISSRFGRKFIQLLGAHKKDVALICEANGVFDKKLHTAIFNECEPKQKKIGTQFIPVVEDMRRLKRIIKREQIKSKDIV